MLSTRTNCVPSMIPVLSGEPDGTSETDSTLSSFSEVLSTSHEVSANFFHAELLAGTHFVGVKILGKLQTSF